jgi:2-octaprenyl-6-methoxyphenol hydroxylase
VWVEKPDRARELMSMQPDKFEQVLQSSMNNVLGEIRDISARGAFPLQGLTARQFAKVRVFLVGEAAHVIPPIGAQGLNLGFRDAAYAAQFIVEARGAKQDIGAPEVLKKYEMSRRSDIVSRTVAVDALNRSLGSSFLPLQGLRGVGLFMLKNVASLRKAAMRRGMASGENLPRVMRET